MFPKYAKKEDIERLGAQMNNNMAEYNRRLSAIDILQTAQGEKIIAQASEIIILKALVSTLKNKKLKTK